MLNEGIGAADSTDCRLRYLSLSSRERLLAMARFVRTVMSSTERKQLFPFKKKL